MAETFTDHYESLSIPFGTSTDLVKKTFRALAKIYHPDNRNTGSREKFEKIHSAYSVLCGTEREQYDRIYLEKFSTDSSTLILPESRLRFTGELSKFARMGLLKNGIRTKDRKKITGVSHDFDLYLRKEELHSRISVRIPLTVRILCPECRGSDIHCECCRGIGTYKSTRYLNLGFEKNTVVNERIYELELSRFRPDRFIHFKKRILRVKIIIV